MPAVSSQTVASTCFTYHGRMARLSCPGRLIKYQDGAYVTVTCRSHPSRY